MSAPAAPRRLRELCHELSQPLTAARCSLELALQLDANDPARADYSADALAALDRMAEIVVAIRNLPEAS